MGLPPNVVKVRLFLTHLTKAGYAAEIIPVSVAIDAPMLGLWKFLTPTVSAKACEIVQPECVLCLATDVEFLEVLRSDLVGGCFYHARWGLGSQFLAKQYPKPNGLFYICALL